MLKRKLKKLLLNPYRIAKKNPRIKLDPTVVLLDGVRFDFRSDGGAITVGRDSLVGCNFIFESEAGEIVIGERCHINSGSHLIARRGITIGNDVNIAWGTYVYDNDSHSLDWRERVKDVGRELEAARRNQYLATGKDWSVVKAAPITICDKAWIGFEVVIMKGVTIGEGAVVGARSVVGSDVAPWTVVAGNPARVIKSIEPR